jgi:hypothetical protein
MNWKQRSAEYLESHAYRLGAILELQPFKPGNARGKSRGGQWLCEVCLQMKQGPKDAHKRACQGLTPYRGKK